ncbi:helix-turn-helix transcriptional regulator [Streptomyces tsukubensis]|nr:helix-turn-helix transcriptional regulator [Streptomyces tsukubensis]
MADSPLIDRAGCPLPDARVLILKPDDRRSPREIMSSVRIALGRPSMGGCSPEAELTAREYQVLNHLGAGLTQRQVARRLEISPHTVDTYVKRIRKKIGPGNKAHLAQATFLQLL